MSYERFEAPASAPAWRLMRAERPMATGAVADLVAQGALYALAFAALALALVGRRNRERDPCFRAFLHNHRVAMAVFAGIATDFALRGPD